MIKTFKILSLLLDYPTNELRDNLNEIPEAIEAEKLLTDLLYEKLQDFLKYASAFTTLREWQQDYVQLFDTSTQTNLYLFDFVYGSSKERGQAMVDLKESYLQAGMTPSDKELPDYLPMFLEFVSSQPSFTEASKVLGEIHPVLQQMEKRFGEATHPYAPLIRILVSLSSNP